VRVAILTGGGDCPGLNAVIRAVVRAGLPAGHGFIGIEDGWGGLLEDRTIDLDADAVRGILPRGGTILGSSGVNPLSTDGGVERVRATLDRLGVDGVIAIGGEGTLHAAAGLVEQGIPVIGVPKTIDNDLPGTEVTVGFRTAAQVATDAVDRLHSTAESHDRVMVVEVMGRHAGWIALEAALGGGADALLIPEVPFDLDEICRHLRHRHMTRASFSIVVVAEGAVPADEAVAIPDYPLDANGFPRLGGIAESIAPQIEQRTGYQSRVTILGHVQRGGSPVAFDRVLGTRFGLAALRLAEAGAWGRMVSRQGQEVVDVDLQVAAGPPKLVPLDRYREAEVFFG
jgi:6-phosphofructokinase 1